MNSKPIWASLLLTLSLSSAARAQAVTPAAPMAPVWYPQESLAHVRIDAAPSTDLKVVYADAPAGSAPIAQCQDHCDFWAWPGKYTLYTRDRSTGKQKQLPLRIKRSSRYVFEAGDDGRAAAGLVVAGVGSAAAIAALVLLTKALVSSYCDGDCNESSHIATAGIISMAAAAVATPVGWIMYANNRTRLSRYNDPSYPTSGTQVRVGVVGIGLGGFGLGGVATF